MKLRIASLTILCLAIAALPAAADTIYANGPTNGICDVQGCTVDGWTVGFGFTVASSINLSAAATVDTAQFAFWMFPGDTLTSVSWEFGTGHDDGTYGSGTSSGANLSQSFISSNQYGYDINLITISGLGVNLPAGTSWLTLTDAEVASGDPAYWDENNGPSQGYENSLGTIPSESFNLQGGGPPPTVPEPSSILLLGSGILGIAGILRRKLF